MLIVVVLCVLGGAKAFLDWAFPDEKSRAESVELARRIASCSQRIRQISIRTQGGVVIFDLVADDEYMVGSRLVFWDTHPDFETLAEINVFSVLEFRFQEEPVGLNVKDATAYLRLKN
jgi:hypothetical protein